MSSAKSHFNGEQRRAESFRLKTGALFPLYYEGIALILGAKERERERRKAKNEEKEMAERIGGKERKKEGEKEREGERGK